MYARRAPSGEIATSLILLALGIESRTAAAREEGAGSCARRDAQRNNGATIQKKNRAFILVSTLRSIQRVNNVQSTAHHCTIRRIAYRSTFLQRQERNISACSPSPCDRR